MDRCLVIMRACVCVCVCVCVSKGKKRVCVCLWTDDTVLPCSLTLSHPVHFLSDNIGSSAWWDQLPGIYVNCTDMDTHTHTHTQCCSIACSVASLCCSVVLVSGAVSKLTTSWQPAVVRTEGNLVEPHIHVLTEMCNIRLSYMFTVLDVKKEKGGLFKCPVVLVVMLRRAIMTEGVHLICSVKRNHFLIL